MSSSLINSNNANDPSTITHFEDLPPPIYLTVSEYLLSPLIAQKICKTNLHDDVATNQFWLSMQSSLIRAIGQKTYDQLIQQVKQINTEFVSASLAKTVHKISSILYQDISRTCKNKLLKLAGKD